MPQRWAIRLAIEGDLRFLSHHDVMRAMERIAARADLPLRYSQGFNPRPKLSLACPRPVGVATRDDLLILSLESCVAPDHLLGALNACAPRGMRFVSAALLCDPGSPRPVRAHLELPVPPEKLAGVRNRMGELDRTESWEMERWVSAGRKRAMRTRTIDIRPLVENIRVEDGTLRFALVRRGDLWARPGEVLRAVGLDERADLARTVRTEVEYET